MPLTLFLKIVCLTAIIGAFKFIMHIWCLYITFDKIILYHLRIIMLRITISVDTWLARSLYPIPTVNITISRVIDFVWTSTCSRHERETRPRPWGPSFFLAHHSLTLVYRKYSRHFLMEKTCFERAILGKYFIVTSAWSCSLSIRNELYFISLKYLLKWHFYLNGLSPRAGC